MIESSLKCFNVFFLVIITAEPRTQSKPGKFISFETSEEELLNAYRTYVKVNISFLIFNKPYFYVINNYGLINPPLSILEVSASETTTFVRDENDRKV